MTDTESNQPWGYNLGLTEAEVIAHLHTVRFLVQPSLWGHAWGRPYDEFYEVQTLTLENDKLHVDFDYGLELNIFSPQGFSLWRDRIHFKIFGSDLTREAQTLIIERAGRVRWEKKTDQFGPRWLVEFLSSKQGSFELSRIEGGGQTFWQNYVVPGKPAFSAELKPR